MKRIDLVFRSIGERTAEAARTLAIQHIQPTNVHDIENIRPFARTVERMLRINHEADYVVYVDADCLILEDLRPFLEFNTAPFVDAEVIDPFRGRIQAGVHILRFDLVQAMKNAAPSRPDRATLLRPESHLRNRVMQQLDMNKATKKFRILHDHFQTHADLFAKYAIRELRSRTDKERNRLEQQMRSWSDEPAFRVARSAVAHARETVPDDAPDEILADYIDGLPRAAEERLAGLNLPGQPPFSLSETKSVEVKRPPETKLFGIGLCRTGTDHLHKALDRLGFDIAHTPADPITLEQLTAEQWNLSLLDHYDGITDLPAAPFFRELDAAFPGSRFILTVRNERDWLSSMRRFLKEHNLPEALCMAAFGRTDFDEDALLARYRAHLRAVRKHFRKRPGVLLVLNLPEGDGWEKLCCFLKAPIPDEPFPFPETARRKPSLLNRLLRPGHR
ncbi:MAG: sulfotransferase family protein [Verrucomicrobiota bacterium]